jgi:hypothetical protein
MTTNTPCPVCQRVLSRPPQDNGDRTLFDCKHCGTFGLGGAAATLLPRNLERQKRLPAVFSHYLRRMQITDNWPVITWEVAQKILKEGTLPSPREQADNLIRWLGDASSDDPGKVLGITHEGQGAIFGTTSDDGLAYIVTELLKAELLEAPYRQQGNISTVQLTFEGWGRYEELRQGAPSGRVAFMAMKFGDPTLDAFLSEHLRPAVKLTGFELRRLDDVPKAGLIDDRLRVEIRACRFLIADLTHANNGAYWEAGYAEGLGKPVIYTCEKSVFSKNSHFDTNHHLTVRWEPDKLAEAAQNLTNTIRATIPEASRAP